MENQEPVQTENQNVASNQKFEPVGAQIPPKKKSKKGALLVILLLLVAVVGIFAYYYFAICTNPKTIYQGVLKSGINSLNQTTEEVETLKSKMKLDMNVTLEEDMDEANLILDLINNTQLELELQMDKNEEELLYKLNSTYENEALLNVNMLIDVKEEKTYIKAEQFFAKALKINIEDNEFYSTMKTLFETQEKTLGSEISRNKAIGILNKEFSKMIKDEYCSKSKEEITINSKTITANKYVLTMTHAQLNTELKTIMENLKNNEEFLNCFEEKEDILETLENTLSKLNDYDIDENGTLSINLYKKGLSKEIIGFNLEITSDNETVVMKVKKSGNTYNFVLLDNEKEICKGTIQSTPLDSNTSKLDFNLDIPEYGKINLIMEASYSTDEPIDTIDTANSVTIDELSQNELIIAYAKLLDSKLYEIIQKFIGLTSLQTPIY